MDDDLLPPQRPPSPPIHTTFATRGINPPSFSAFRPRDLRFPSTHTSTGFTHVAWSCDGRRLAAVGIDRVARTWAPERNFDVRNAGLYRDGHMDDIDHVSWNPTHPELFCTSSRKDKRIVFWDARQSKHIQRCEFKPAPMRTVYSPDGKTLVWVATGRYLLFLHHGKNEDGSKDHWIEGPSPNSQDKTSVSYASSVLFNHAGTSLITALSTDPKIRILDYPSRYVRYHTTIIANVGGCSALALDPHGRFLAIAGADSIVNVFETKDWFKANTLTSCDHPITGLDFSHDGEYIAASTTGEYIEIFGTATGQPLYRLKTAAPSPTVAWHPSKHIFAYCGRITRDTGPSYPVVSLFGPGA